ncbi:Hypothetical predicted protein, partial [Marmota monax]
EAECNNTRQAACGGKCIPVAWLCNGEQECADGTDEQCDDGIKILIARDQELGFLDRRTGNYETLIPIKSRPISIAYDLERSTYFWVDEVLNVFVLGKPNSVPLYPELTAVNSISLDWSTGQLYWASSFARVICAGLSDGRGYVKILEKDLVPEQLVVFPEKKYLYWVNRGGTGVRAVESAGMDGSDRKVLTVLTTEEPLGLTLDHVTGRLYWISEYKKSIETVKVDGSGRYTFPEIFLEDENPVGLAVFENSFFWANKTQLFHTSPHSPKERELLLDASVSAFLVLHKSQQPKELKLVFSSGKRLYLLKVGSMGSAIERTLVEEHSGNIYLLDIDWKRNLIYWTNAQGHLVYSTGYSGQKLEIWTRRTGLQSLSLLKNRTYSLNKSWSDGLIAAHEPYLVTVDQAALVLWNRKTLEPFSVLKESYVKKMIILAENQEVPDPEIEGATMVPPTLPPPPPLLCTRSSVPCQDGKECISRESLCDGQRDCQDGSDEENCSQLCHKPGVFQCLDGRRCIEEKYHCDGAQHCLDGSDELSCWKPVEECSLRCDNKTRCIPKSWLCDGNPDCSDKRDEQGCVHEKCSPSEFRCENGQFITFSLHCDGNRDCLDHSDEEDCPVAWPLWCPPGEVKCRRSGECVLAEWICDHDLDCKDGSDEKDCDPEVLQCGPTQWSCASRDQCVPDSWHCDGHSDCRDGSDEAGCPPQKCLGSEFRCGTDACLSLSEVCDGKEDCSDGSDEGGVCSLAACSPGQCSHTCYPSPAGPICACEQGFQLESRGRICQDVNECQESGSRPCSQTCVNTQGSYICTCRPGYLLEPDGHTCKATGAEPVLLVAIQFNLFLYGLRSLKEDILATTDKNLIIFSVDYDLVDQKVFWADLNAESIKWISMDTKKKGTVVKGIKSNCLMVDWIGRNLYWTDGTAGQILAIQLTAIWRGKSEYTIVLDDDLTQPQSLALDPLNGLMYWSEIGEEPQIEQAGMDGSDRKILISQGLGRPTSIALDQLSWKIFWSDDKFHCIGSANLDGTGISMLQLTQIKNPFSVAVFEDEVFWSEMKTRTVQRVQKMTGKNRAVLIKRSGQPYGLKIMHEVLQPRSSNPCLDTGCSHLCLLSPRSKGSCHCPVGLLLADDGTTCVPLKESAFVFLVLPTVIMQVSMGGALSLGIFFTYNLNFSTRYVLLAIMTKISENLYRPVSVVLHPPTAVMCFVDLGSLDDRKRGSSIECASMDGSRRKMLWRKSQVPVGLAFSDSGTRLYWADTGRGLIESIQQDGSRHRVDRQGIQGLNLFTFGQGMMFWTTTDDAQITKVWYSKTEVLENRWFQVDQKIVDLKVYSKFSQQDLRKSLILMYFYTNWLRTSTASSRNLTYNKENDQEEENLMNSEIFVNEAYDEQELLTSLQTD